MNTPTTFVAGNYFDKYRSRNVVHAFLMKRFIRDACDLFRLASPSDVLEVGTGPGDLAAAFLSLVPEGSVEYKGVDISREQVELAQSRYPHINFSKASAYELPFEDNSADLVVCCEVLEHLKNPKKAMDEIARVSSKYVLISVPWEPVWRICNVLRGKYIGDLGNTPGHLNHFSRSGIKKLVSKHFSIVEERRPFPWTMVLGESSS